MTEPETCTENTEQRIRPARETVRREAMRLAQTAQCAAEWEAGQ
jgi:hypothetical protein